MTTILEFVHSAATPHTSESLPAGLADHVQAALHSIEEREVEILFPLTIASTLVEAEKLALAGETEYRRLVEEWIAVRQEAGILPAVSTGTDIGSASDAQWTQLPDTMDNDRWQGALQSEAAYVAWMKRQVAVSVRDAEQEQEGLPFGEAVGPFLRFQMTKWALLLALASPLSLPPQNISALSQLADKCMTEVEDIFLGQAETDDDDGEVVPLAEVRANLGL